MKECGEKEKNTKAEGKATMEVAVTSINVFYEKSTRNENDSANKLREEVLKGVGNGTIPSEYFDNSEYGEKWKTLDTAWKDVIKKIAITDLTDILSYTSTKIQVKGGRKFNYDIDLLYYNGTIEVARRKLEFKNGGSSIQDLPQFLSLQVKCGLFPVTYDTFFYYNSLDKYIACDNGITEKKPSFEVYIKEVGKTSSKIPFFTQLKEREEIAKSEKANVVNDSIKDYLEKYGPTIESERISNKIKDTQKEKLYILWSNGAFHLDQIFNKEMEGLHFHGIKNGNSIQLSSAEYTIEGSPTSATKKTIYNLLLRWRNHKGILNPAWQIKLER
jgi:hypothetical protein